MKIGRLIALVSALLLIHLGEAQSGGVLFVYPPEMKGEFFPIARLSIKSSDSFVVVSDKSLEFNFCQTFENDNEFPLQSIFILPILDEGAKSEIEVSIDDKSTDYQFLDKLSTQTIVRKLTQEHSDHDLLSIWGHESIVVKSIYLEARERKNIRVRYISKQPKIGDLLTLKVSLIGERYSLGPIDEINVRVKFKIGQSVRTSLSPSHRITTVQEGPFRKLVTFRGKAKKILQDFELLTTLGGTTFDVRALVENGAQSKNYFLLMLEPSPSMANVPSQKSDLDVVFLIDSSGSLSPDHLGFVKSLVINALDRLSDSDKINLISFNSNIKKFSPRFVVASKEHKTLAKSFVTNLQASGGSDLLNGILSALELFNMRKRGGVIIMFTDGRPSVGVTNFDVMAETIKRLNKYRSRFFIVNNGDRPNVFMMDKLSSQIGGTSFNLSEDHPVDEIVGKLISQVSTPNLSEISVEYQEMLRGEIYPDSIPGISANETVCVVGNYDKSPSSADKIVAKVKFRGKTRSASISLTKANFRNESRWIETLWAMRKLGRMVEAEQHKYDSQNFDSISRFCDTYGFVNPFAGSESRRRFPEIMWNLVNSFVPQDVMHPYYRLIGDRLLKLSDGSWRDIDFKSGMPELKLLAFSNDFFSLLEKESELSKFFCLGPAVTVVRKGLAISSTINRN